jgi:hypothetical protein
VCTVAVRVNILMPYAAEGAAGLPQFVKTVVTQTDDVVVVAADDDPDATVMSARMHDLSSIIEGVVDARNIFGIIPESQPDEFSCAYRVGNYSTEAVLPLGSPSDIEMAVQDFLKRVKESLAAPTDMDDVWARTVEILIGWLERLLDDNDRLREQLEQAIGDRDVANARLEQLQAAYEILYNERYRTKEKPDRTNIWAGAAVVASVLVPVVDDLGDRFIKETADKAAEVAEVVIQQCNIDAPIIIDRGSPPGYAHNPAYRQQDPLDGRTEAQGG